MNGPLRVERGTFTNADFPHELRMTWGPMNFTLGGLTGEQADAIEAQLAGPDLTELREAVEAAEVQYRNYESSIGEPARRSPLYLAARRLVGGTGGAP